MFEWSDTDLIMRDTVRGFIDKEIRPQLDALETGELSPYPIGAQAVQRVRSGCACRRSGQDNAGQGTREAGGGGE